MNTRTPSQQLHTGQALAHISAQWDQQLIAELSRYISIPAKSPLFEPDWEKLGFIDTVLRNAADWATAQQIPGLRLEIVRLPGRTPVLFFEVDGTAERAAAGTTALMYGHMDKQPEFDGWRSDLGPWTPKYEDGKLYGRGSADDGYAFYAGIAAIQEVKRQNLPHPRIVGLIETCEESGSADLLPYIDVLRPRMGNVGLVMCLDSGAGNYDQFWLTSSLRGMTSGTLKVEVLTEGVHSGDASGVVPSSFRILRQLLDRLEDSKTGRVLPKPFHCEVPPDRMAQIRATADILGKDAYARFPWVHYECDGTPYAVLPATTDPVQALIGRTWAPTLSVTGADGLPPLHSAGNVLRPFTALKLSVRLPPLANAAVCAQELKTLLENDAPYQARVTFTTDGAADGWNAPASAPWFQHALDTASHAYFGAPCGYIGQGGSIPLINLLSQNFPHAQMMVCGVLGPNSNAHGPNECLHVPYAKKLTASVAAVIAAMAQAGRHEAAAN